MGISGRGMSPRKIDLTTGCVDMNLPKSASPWAKVQSDLHAEGCGGVTATDPALLAHARVWTRFQAQRAAVRGDLVSVSAYGYRGAELESLRPKEALLPGDLSFGGIGSKPLTDDLATRPTVAIVYRMMADTHPGLLVGGDHGAACLSLIHISEPTRPY